MATIRQDLEVDLDRLDSVVADVVVKNIQAQKVEFIIKTQDIESTVKKRLSEQYSVSPDDVGINSVDIIYALGRLLNRHNSIQLEVSNFVLERRFLMAGQNSSLEVSAVVDLVKKIKNT